jgi:hypothetical protein
MAVVFGKFEPNANYAGIKPTVQAFSADDDCPEDKKMSVVTPEQFKAVSNAYRNLQNLLVVKTKDGVVLGKGDCVVLKDYSHLEGLDEEAMQIEIFNIEKDIYQKYFQAQITAYANQFRSDHESD